MTTFQHFQKILTRAFVDCSIRWNFIGAFFFLLVGIFVDISLPILLKKTVDTFSIDQEKIWISWLLLSYGLMWIVSQVSQHTRFFLASRIEQRITSLLGIKVLSHLYSIPHRYFTSQKPGAVTNIIRRAQRDIPNIILGLFFHVLPIFIKFICVLIGIIIFYPLFYIIILTAILVCFFAYTLIVIKAVMKLREQANNVDRETDGIITDWISNYEAIKTFNRHNFAVRICTEALKKKEKSEVAFLRKYSWVKIGQAFILGLGLSALTYYVGIGVHNGELTVGDFVLFNGYILQFVGPIVILGHVIEDIKKSILGMKGVVEILSTEPDIQVVKNPVNLLEGTSFSVEFFNVSFYYEDRVILKNLSFRIEPGQTAFIIGKTGIGKSTIAKLLLRLYDPTEGDIYINEVNIKNLSLDSLYKAVGWVPQESYLLNDTIFNNVGFIQENTTEKDVKEALNKAHLSHLIQKLPKGLNTIIGDRGIKLSGGEKQRLAIARIFLKNPKICIFDEISSSLDKNTDANIQKSIQKYIPYSTKIIITHREYFVNKGDQVIDLK